MKLVLEPRFLFDGSITEAVGRGADHDRHAEASHAEFHADNVQGNSFGDNPASGRVAVDAHAPAIVNPAATQLMFVDPRVANWRQLIEGVASDVEIIVIDTNRNGIDQVSAALAGRQNLAGLQFVTNGSPGAIELGHGAVNSASLMAQSDAVAGWADHLAPHADIALWGSEVGNGNAGAAFLADLHTLTGADIGAASHAVGADAMGANWVLDAKLGTFDLASPFSAEALAGIPSEILTAIPALATNMAATDLIFIDPRVAGWDQLAAGAEANAQVIVIDPSRDAVAQITQALQGRTGISAINLVAYGSAGALDIGVTPLTAALVAANADQIATWGGHLAPGADINLWGCDVADGDGRALLAGLASLTGADVAASTETVGNPDFGGIWILNTATGVIEASVPFNAAARGNFTNVLDPSSLSVTVTQDKAIAQSGDVITYTIVVANPSSHFAGDDAINLSVTLSSNVTQIGVITPAVGNPIMPDSSTALNIRYDFSTLATGASLTFTVSATVKDNLPTQTAMLVSARATYDSFFTGSGTNDTGPTQSLTLAAYTPAFTSNIELVGESNANTAGVANATPASSISATIGDIVRVQAYVRVPEGSNPSSLLDITLPTGLAFQNDNSAKIAFASPNSALLSSTIDPTGTLAQVSESGGAINPATITPTASPASLLFNIDTATAGHVKFNFGTLSNNAHSATPNYIVVAFNAIVQNVGGNVSGVADTLTAVLSTTAVVGTTNIETFVVGNATPPTPTAQQNLSQTVALPLFDTSLGTLTGAKLTLTGAVSAIGSLTNTGGSTENGDGGANATFTVASGGTPTLTLPVGLRLSGSAGTVYADDTNNGLSYSVAAGATQVLNNPTGSRTTLPQSVLAGSLSQYTSAVPGATAPVTISAIGHTYVASTGGNFIANTSFSEAASISVTYTYTANPTNTVSSGNATITIVEPRLTLTKTVTGVNTITGAITFQDVITTTGNVTAYGATLNDPEAATNAGAITGLTVSGTATGATGTGAPTFGVSGGTAVTGAFALAPGASETITYTVAVTDRTAALPNSTASVNWNSLNGGQQTAFGTTNGLVGSGTGSRTDPVTGVANAAVNTYTTSVTLGYGALSGRIWDGLGPFNTTYNLGGDIDIALTGVTVSATGLDPNTGGAKTTTTT
ncbi:MAG: DUF4347 domain-containing protein, partial [Acetobacteraceae bacterium]|nr:DUF4347 domain-containing protein [Acetobacteraceae bacterium]